MKKLNFKSLILALTLLTIGTGQMWATYYAIGELTAWNHTASETMTRVGTTNTYYKVVSSMSAGKYRFRVDEGNWEKTHGWSQAITGSSDFTLTDANDGDNSMHITLSSATSYLTIWFDSDDNKVWVTNGNYATQTIYVIGSNSWTDNTVKAHVFSGDAAYYAWASDQTMTKSSTISRAGITYKVYSYTFPKGYKSAIFRYGGSQTGNLDWSASNPYYSMELSAWFATTADALAKYLAGANWTGASWSTTASKMTDNGDGSYSKDIAIPDASKTISLKICKYNTWTDAFGGDAAGTGHNLSTDFGKDGDGNLTFQVTHAGTTKITLTSTGVINVDAPYQVSYAAGTGATGTVSASSVTTYGSTCTLSSSTFSKTGYTQDGWATSDGGDKAYSLGGTYTGGYVDVTLYPHWSANEYTTSNNIKESDGSTNAGTYKVIYDATSITYTTTPSKTGYNVEGLYYETSLTNKIVNSDRSLRSSTSYTTNASKWNQTSAPNMYVKWQAKTYTETNNIKDEDGTTSKGTYTATYDATSITINTTPTKSGYHVEGYYISTTFTSANKVANASGALEASVSGFTDASRHWIKDAKVNLYVHWEEDAANYSLTFGVANSPYNTGSLSVTAGGAAASSGTEYVAGTSIACTATPNTHTRVKGWYSDNSCTSAIGGAGTGNTYNFSLSANTTVYVGFETATTDITLSGNGGSNTSVTATHGSVLPSFSASSRTGYTLNGYFTNSSGGTKIINADGTLVKNVSGYTTNETPAKWDNKDRTMTLHAQWSEVMSSLTTANSYDGASAGFANPTVSNSATNVGYVTSRTITAHSNDLGYTLTSWTITGGTRTDGGAENANPITVRSNGDGAAVTVTANYVGSNRMQNIYLSGTMNSWTTSSSDWQFYKLPGESGNTATLTVDIDKGDFYGDGYKIGFNIYHSDWVNKWWRGTTSNAKMDAHNCSNWAMTTQANDDRTYLDLNVSGTYTFTLTNCNSYSSQALTVTYPDKSFVEGDFPEPWDEDEYTLSEDGNIQSVTINITSTGDKEFRLVSHGKLFGTSTHITKASNSQTLSAKNMADAGAVMTIEAYVTGNYTFSYNKSTKVLTVTYPVYNQVRISAASPTDASNTGDYDLSAPVSNVRSVTRSLKANTTYTFKILYDSEWYGFDSGTFTRNSSTSSNSRTISTSGGDMTLTTDYAGDYTFKFNQSTKALSVDFPAAYKVTYGKGSVDGSSGNNCSAVDLDNSSAAVTSNSTWVKSGHKVKLTAPTEDEGYTFDGWFDNNAGSGVAIDANKVCTLTVNSAKTAYACYHENDYTINVAATTGGTITTPTAPTTTVTAHPATGATIVAARANEAWHFTGWTSNSNKVSFGDASAVSTTVTTTADATVTANFVPRFALTGSLASDDNPGHGMPGWEFANAADFEVKSFTGLGEDGVCLQCTLTLDPNETYKFRVLDRDINNRRGCSSPSEPENVLPAGSNWELNYTEGSGAHDVRIKTVGRGTYIFHITKLSDDGNNYPSLQVERQASWLVSIGQGYEDIDGTIHTNSSTGGTMAAEATESGTTVAITDGKYIANGGKLEWSVTPATGYTLGHYYGSSSLTGDAFDFTKIDPVNAAANVYAKFVETATAVTIEHNEHGHVTVGGATATSTTVGITTTRALVAVPDAGYYFAGWTIEGSDIELQDKSEDEDAEVTLHGLGAGIAATLTANFVELDKIYFRNIDESTGNRLWNQDHIYVYFGTTWANDKGVQTLTNYAEMSPALGTKIYWAYVPHAFTKSNNTHVAFSDVDMHTNNEFYNNHGVYREDYNKALNMFVPNRTSSGTTNGTVYHSNGFWRVYDPQVGKGQGYYLQLHTGDDGKGQGNYDQKGEFTATADGATTIEYTMRVDNTSTQTQYRIASAGGVHYTASATITSAACTNVTVNEYKNCTDCYFTVTPTSEGDYKFIINQDGDQMHITIDYPVSVGDYRLKHTYLGKKRTDPTVDSTYCTYSDVIKSSGASTPRTLSMYLNTAGDDALVLQKCTAIVAGSPAWDAGDATNLAGVLTTVGTNGNGVYQFDVAVSADKVAAAPTATKYTGPYYIKTDGATGGWANYTLNGMSENTLNYDTEHRDKSFNYYYCKYYNDAGRNLKCIIANDYCNALTDTLKGDDVIGAGNQTTPSAVSVRFSYNSYTNEIQRSYLGASLTSDFLRIEGNTTASKPHIYDKDETTFDDSHADAYITFVDKQNWRYEIDVKADVNAHAKLTAAFNGTTQYFWGHAGEVGHEWDDENTSQLFGGNSGTYGLTLIYDFKTNNLISAWKPTGGTIDDDLSIQSDVILLREHQEAPTTITFAKKEGGSGDYASITEVKTVYGVLRLNRWKLNNRAHPEDIDPDHCKTADLINTHHAALNPGDAGYLPQAERELYFISFPFDVQMSDIISFSTYYTTWGIMYYDGKNRAKNGYWIDSESNWKYFTPAEYATKKLNAYEGYLIGVDLSAMRYNNTDFWTNNSSEVDIYFPSRTAVGSITQKEVTVNIDTVGYKCSINRDYGGSDGDRRIKDSHWHCIGVPAYANLDHDIEDEEPNDETWSNTSLLYLYEWDTETNEHSIKEASTYSFQAMYAYLVQYAGTTLSWSAAAATGPLAIAAKRMQTEELRDRQFNLQLLQGNKEADHTYIRLSADEEVTSGFEFNHDVSKMMHSKANIYTLIGTEQAAANSLPLDMEQTTVVPVGVRIKTAGEYTFSMPDGTDGIGVTLIDNVANTQTNLALGNYTVSLPAGTIDNRFSLSISPIQQAPTGLEAIERQAAGEGARKVMVDGILYILRDGKVYDAQGRRAQ